VNIVILDTSQQIARLAAEQVIGVVQSCESPVLGMAAGATPLLLYAQLIHCYGKGQISFRSTSTFNLDEYVALPPDSTNSYRYYMQSNFFDHVDLQAKNSYLPDGRADDLQLAAKRYERTIASTGGIDLQILGIGTNGHIGFNEPGSSFASRTRVVALSDSTIDSNRHYFGESGAVPEKAITVGIGSILDSRGLLLIATGEHKAEAVRAALEGPVSPICPASAVQLHPKVTVLLDRAAASQLTHRDDYIKCQQTPPGLASATPR
jgi:glucosamine-6-phosphate deaminase